MPPTTNLALVTMHAGVDSTEVRAALTARSAKAGADRVLIGDTMRPNLAGGDLIWRLGFSDRARWQAAAETISLADEPRIAHVDWAAFEVISAGARPGAPQGGVYRQMMMHVPTATPPGAIAQFESETLGLPGAIPQILRWTLGRVFASGGDRVWTHVWEQEFATAADFAGPYMHHPWHWSAVDRWFDPEMPERIVDRRLCNSLCALSGEAPLAP